MPANTNPLTSLRDIHLPPPVSFWPPAPGWTVLAAIILLIGFVLAYFYLKRCERARAKNAALKKLQQLQQLQDQQLNAVFLLGQLSSLLKRVALAYFPREQVAGLTGVNWLLFLNKTGDTKNFTSTAGRLLMSGPYQNKITENITPLFAYSKEWIRHV